MKLDDIGLGLNEIMALYTQKAQYMKEANLIELLRLKNLYPELFEEEKEMELTNLLSTMNYLMQTSHFKAMLDKEKKKELVQIDYQNWKVGGLERVIEKYVSVDLNNMDIVAREMVKEAIVVCWDILRWQQSELIPINSVFPYLGLLLSELVCQTPAVQRWHKMPTKRRKMITAEKMMPEAASKSVQIDNG